MGIPLLRAIVCGENAAVPRLLRFSGFELMETVEFAHEAWSVVARERPDVVVVDIAACGVVGLSAVSRLHRASPESVVIVLSPFENLRSVALESGASQLVGTDDLRPLLGGLEQIRRTAHGGLACPCCAGPTTAAASDPARSRITGPGGRGSTTGSMP